VWAVVRQLPGCTRLLAVAEARSAHAAWQHALALNARAEHAWAATPATEPEHHHAD
jgi:hypothetical protein